LININYTKKITYFIRQSSEQKLAYREQSVTNFLLLITEEF